MSDNALHFTNLASQPGIKHAISTKTFGSMKKEDLSVSHVNLMKFGGAANISSAIISMKQVHSGTVAVVENIRELVIPATDALVTNKKNIPLVVITADCIPLLLFDPEKKVVGVAHAGYKGLLNDIIPHTIEKFVSAFGSDPRDIIVGLGPCIETTCYEVGHEVTQQFDEKYPLLKNIYQKKDTKFFLDLRGIAEQVLQKEGILKEHIEIMDMCTKCSKDSLYSYRGGDKTGRFASIISLV